jgi:hypothetical protein
VTACTAGIIVDSGVDVTDGAPVPEGLVVAAPPIGSFVTLEGVQRQAVHTGEELGGIREWAVIQPIGYGTIDSAGTPTFSPEVARVANMCRLWADAQAQIRDAQQLLLRSLVEEKMIDPKRSAAVSRDIARGRYIPR